MSDENKRMKKVVEEKPDTQTGSHLPPKPGLEIWIPDENQTTEVKTGLKGSEGSHLDSSDMEQVVKNHYIDASSMSKESLTKMLSAFGSNVLNVQVDSKSNAYFNPDGLIYFGDLINMVSSEKDDSEAVDSDDGLVFKTDYFAKGYSSLIENNPSLKGKLTREQLFSPVTHQFFCAFITSPTTPKDGLFSNFTDLRENHSVYEDLVEKGILNKKNEDYKTTMVTRLELAKFYNHVTGGK